MDPYDRRPPVSPWDELAAPPPVPAPPRRGLRWRLPAVLFVLTCLSTTFRGLPLYEDGHLRLPPADPVYAVCVMFILGCHELGHYLQARRYRVPASLPYFLPMPISPIGTMGAIIGMRAGVANARALFDIAITGPLAGLVPALVASVVGLRLSEVRPLPAQGFISLGEPLLFRFLSRFIVGAPPDGMDILLHPVAFAGWVGLFITALNLIPIGQLDGGHILYALLKKKAHPVAVGLLIGAMVGVVVGGYWGWVLMILLLLGIGPRHPPTADDWVPLGTTRVVLGWLTLLFVVVGFTPVPLSLGGAP